MANTIVYGAQGFSITFDGATVWDGIDKFPAGIIVESFEFKPTATDDLIAIRELDASGRLYLSEKSATGYDNKIKYFNTEKSRKRFFPYVVGNQVSAGAILIVELK